ncbi:hypothetical protein AMATHDRAFT_157088 [Amanita thiersii Skay4041]|uniref:Actin-like ATPase domain-containing protein n=1 Tax=Amanita thiersii Skay4041 TaxID=703135 RepID=A0A2A9NEB0_9AGAR|nr:hypothetical protein AMATHDRAFT_157088 [Amanita thiersii Skay4041]
MSVSLADLVVSPAVPVPLIASDPIEEGKMCIAIDFGSTFSGVAYGSARIAGGRIQQILNWPGASGPMSKVPTCLLYDELGRVLAWGLEAESAGLIKNTFRREWFKYLDPQVLRDELLVESHLPSERSPVDLITDFLGCLWESAKEQIMREVGGVEDIDSASVFLTVPATWDANSRDIMREAAIAAALVRNAHASDHTWRDRLQIITESEAAVVHCAFLENMHHLEPLQNFLIVDAGGATCEVVVYKIIKQMDNLEIAEVSAHSANCGSLFLDFRFRELLKLLANHPTHLDSASLSHLIRSFSENDKLKYSGLPDDITDNIFHFTCSNVDGPDDPSIGLIDGQLCIPGSLLREKVFDPVISQVLSLIEDQIKRADQTIHALLLVGGFAESQYLKHCIEVQFGSRIKIITKPPDADSAILHGAVQYGLANRQLVSAVIAPCSYIIKVQLPAEAEDWQKRPAYIRINEAGAPICDNRLQYLITKGAIFRKGLLLVHTYMRVLDSSFITTLFTSNSEKVMRYTDEGDMTELCKWTVALSSLPAFKLQQNISKSGGFYTDFELGLELDGNKVQGILLQNNQEWERSVL